MSFIKINRFFILTIFGIFFISSCSKDSNTSSNTTTPTPTPTTPSCYFLPYKNGTQIQETVFNSLVSYTLKDSTVNNTKYLVNSSIVSTSFEPSFNFLRLSSTGDVIQLIPSISIDTAIIPAFETTLVKPNENVGATWSDSTKLVHPNFTYVQKNVYTIIQKGFTDTILGNPYTNCIKVKAVENKSLLGSNSSTTTYYYWACGFGFYKQEDANSQLLSKVTKLTL